MRVRILSAVLLAAFVFPVAAIAQQESPSTSVPLRSTIERHRYVILPRPPMETVEQDARQAEEKILEQQRVNRLVQESQQAMKRRPDLDYSVVNGIQADNADRALRAQGKLR